MKVVVGWRVKKQKKQLMWRKSGGSHQKKKSKAFLPNTATFSFFLRGTTDPYHMAGGGRKKGVKEGLSFPSPTLLFRQRKKKNFKEKVTFFGGGGGK